MGSGSAACVTAAIAGPVRDWDALGRRWRALEDRVPLSFFQSWTWVGCLARERYPHPVLIEARTGTETVAIALFNRRRHALAASLVLHASGDAALDTVHIEHNGIVGAATEAVLRSALRGRWPKRLLLNGVDATSLNAARAVSGIVRVTKHTEAPFVDLTRDFLPARTANTRQQIRRSDRAYGSLTVRRAETIAEAHQLLDELATLHQAHWRRRGLAGAFAAPFFRTFHRCLIERGMPRGEIDLLRVTANGAMVGVLYNFRFRGQALAYQSGFNYDTAQPPRKPGITCHHAAIRLAIEAGLQRYDFLAGDDRYKRSLSDGSVPLYWLEAGPAWHPGLVARGMIDICRPKSVTVARGRPET